MLWLCISYLHSVQNKLRLRKGQQMVPHCLLNYTPVRFPSVQIHRRKYTQLISHPPMEILVLTGRHFKGRPSLTHHELKHPLKYSPNLTFLCVFLSITSKTVFNHFLWFQWSKFLKARIQRNFAKRPRFRIHKLSYMIQKFHLIIKFENPPITYKFPKLHLLKNIHFKQI